MKTIKNLLIALSFFAPTILSGQTTITPESIQIQKRPSFFINFNRIDCFAGGESISVNVYNSGERRRFRYSFLWEVDGVPYGHDSKIECVTGNTATVHVTQYPTGRRISKSIKLKSVPGHQ